MTCTTKRKKPKLGLNFQYFVQRIISSNVYLIRPCNLFWNGVYVVAQLKPVC